MNHQQIIVAVYRPPRKLIRLAEDETAAFVIVPGHHRFAVIQRVLQPPFPEGFVKFIIGIGAEDTHPDLAVVIDKTGAEIFSFVRHHVHQVAVSITPLHPGHFFPVHPGMPAPGRALPLFCYIKLRIVSHRRPRVSCSLALPCTLQFHTVCYITPFTFFVKCLIVILYHTL